MSENFSLKGKKILITGATSGLGRACALRCAAEGAQIVASGRNAEKLESLKAEIAEPSAHVFVRADLCKQDGLETLLSKCDALDGAVFAAGISLMKPIKFVSDEDISNVFNINMTSVIKSTRELLKRRKLSKGASVVFVSSTAGLVAKPAHSVYAITKAALIRFAQDMAVENSAMRIRFNSISLGMIETPMTKDFIEQDADLYHADLKRYLLGYGTPRQAADAVQFLLSAAADWITGTNLIVDGGYTCFK